MTRPDWSRPRESIATGLTDMQYATHGAWLALEVVRRLGLTIEQARAASVLDFGCGTGRVTRPLAWYFGRAVGYDPSAEAIAAAATECPAMDFARYPRPEYSTAPPARCEYACAISVFEHLDAPEGARAWALLSQLVTRAVLVWARPARNGYLPFRFQAPAGTNIEIVRWEMPRGG